MGGSFETDEWAGMQWSYRIAALGFFFFFKKKLVFVFFLSFVSFPPPCFPPCVSDSPQEWRVREKEKGVEGGAGAQEVKRKKKKKIDWN